MQNIRQLLGGLLAAFLPMSSVTVLGVFMILMHAEPLEAIRVLNWTIAGTLIGALSVTGMGVGIALVAGIMDFGELAVIFRSGSKLAVRLMGTTRFWFRALLLAFAYLVNMYFLFILHSWIK